MNGTHLTNTATFMASLKTIIRILQIEIKNEKLDNLIN